MSRCNDRSRALTALVASLAAASASCAADLPGREADSGVHVALVDKDTVDTFLNRLATPDGQLVVTRAAVAGARQSVELAEEHGASLHLVEGPLPSAPLPGERARVGGFAVVAIPSGDDPHEWLGSHRYFTVPVAEHETAAPRAAQDDGVNEQRARLTAGDLAPAAITIDAKFLEARLKELSGAVPVNVDGRTVTLRERSSSEGRRLARAWLRQQYEALGFTVKEHPYTSGWSRGVNLTADKAGADRSRVLILSAHYDSVGNAGADDDGSGVVSGLAIARALKDAKLRIGLRVVAFDQEESGLVGSKAYARALNQSGELRQVVGVLNLEMTAYDSDGDGHYHVIDCNENTSSELTAIVEAAGRSGDLRLTREDACTNRSDHAAFWTYGTPAVAISENFFGGDGNPCYHERCDTVARLNWDYMRRVTQAAGVAAAQILIQ